MVAGVVVLGRICFVRDVELSVHGFERSDYLCNLGSVAEVDVSAVVGVLAFGDVFAVAHVLNVVLDAFLVGYLPNLVEVDSHVGALPTRTVVNDVQVHQRVVVFVDTLLYPYAVVAVGDSAVAVGIVCFNSRLECLECSGVLFYCVFLLRIIEHCVNIGYGFLVVVEYFLG